MKYTYDKKRHHLTATDRKAVAMMLASIGDRPGIGASTGRNKYSLARAGNDATLTVQNGEGQYNIPLTLIP